MTTLPKTDGAERRTLVEPVEFRKIGDRMQASGYAYVFGKRSQAMDGFVEEVAPGAGKKTLQEQDVRALFNHDPNMILGRMGAGTLRMAEDETGGHYEIDLPNTSTGRDVAELLERRDVVGSSFGFRVIEEDWTEAEDGRLLRTLKQFSLRDVGPVTFPAYTDTTAAVKRLAAKRSVEPDVLTRAIDDGDFALVLDALPLDTEKRQPEPEPDDGRETLTVEARRIGWQTY